MKSNQDIIKKILSIGIISGLIIVAFLIVKPFITAILTAGVLAYIVYPIYKKANKRFKKPNLVAALICICMIIIILFGVWLIAKFAVGEILDFYAYSQTHDIMAPIKTFLVQVVKVGGAYQITALFDQAIAKGSSVLFDFVSAIIINIPLILLQIFVMFFVMFYFLKEGANIVGYLRDVLPFQKKFRQRFFSRFIEITNGFIHGMIIVGFIQGIFAGIGFYVFGASQPFILSILAMFAAIIPLVGAWIVWFPVAVGMIIKGSTFGGIGLLLYGALIVSYVDNFARPYIIGKKIKMSNAIVLLGMLGGLQLFGIIGLIIGPLVLDYLIIFIEFYRTKQIKKLT